jgi:dTDP-4-dehydrorhamnose 3,5-epimerase
VDIVSIGIAVIEGLEEARKDAQTVTGEGVPVGEPIAGVRLHRPPTQADHRGTLVELYDERWEFTEEPLVYAYLVTAAPGSARGWVVHTKQDDRLFFASGRLKVALYDGRRDGPTFGRLNIFHLGTHDRALLLIPAGVWHSVRNVGPEEASFVNFPTRPFDHADPDKYRLPLDTDLIPYRP